MYVCMCVWHSQPLPCAISQQSSHSDTYSISICIHTQICVYALSATASYHLPEVKAQFTYTKHINTYACALSHCHLPSPSSPATLIHTQSAYAYIHNYVYTHSLIHTQWYILNSHAQNTHKTHKYVCTYARTLSHCLVPSPSRPGTPIHTQSTYACIVHSLSATAVYHFPAV